MKQLKPIKEKPEYYLPIEKEINLFFDAVLFSRLQKILNSSIGQYYNEMDSLKNALLKGKIQYNKGRFTGKFSANITKQLKQLGAKWDKGGFSLPVGNIPQEIQQIIGQSFTVFQKLYNQVLEELAAINVDEALNLFSFDTSYVDTVGDLDKVAMATLKQDISIIPEFTQEMTENIASKYNNNMKLYIKDWTEERIVKLRELVTDNTFEGGYRAEALVDIIEKEYGVSRSKAKFLARQETSLLVSEFREQRYKSVGVTKYKWSTSHDVRVRKLHKELNGRVFEWDNPPIIDERTNERGHPGQAFGCRCVCIALVD